VFIVHDYYASTVRMYASLYEFNLNVTQSYFRWARTTQS